MHRTPIVVLSATALVFLGACTTTPDDQKPAPVESRDAKPGAQAQQPQPIKTPPVARVEPKGAPMVDPRSQLKQGVLGQRSIYYDFDKFDVKDEYRGMVEAHAKYLRDNPNARMLIQGNADDRGSREYNLGLGQRRSDGVKKMLMLLGVKEAQIESVSLGEEKPQAEGQNEAAWAKNRRSDILYGGEY